MVLLCQVDDWAQATGLPARPGPVPACADSEVLAFALARDWLGSDSERRFRRIRKADWRDPFPHIPAQSALNRRTPWLRGAFDHLRQHWLRALPPATEAWYTFDTTPLPIRHPSRVGGGDQWTVCDDLRAGFGRCAAKALWFSGVRVATLGRNAPACRRGCNASSPTTAIASRARTRRCRIRPSRTRSRPDGLGTAHPIGRQVCRLHPARRLAPRRLGR